jgi:hypothetical protein
VDSIVKLCLDFRKIGEEVNFKRPLRRTQGENKVIRGRPNEAKGLKDNLLSLKIILDMY